MRIVVVVVVVVVVVYCIHNVLYAFHDGRRRHLYASILISQQVLHCCYGYVVSM